MDIFLVSHTENDRVKNIKVCGVKFYNFSIDLSDFDALVATSKNSIKALKNNSINLVNLEVFSIGQSTTKAALDFGFTQIYTAKNSHGNEFAHEIIPLLKNKKVIFLKAKDSVSNIREILIKNHINLSEILAYETEILNLSKDEILSKIPPKNSVLIFTSPSNVKGFLQNFNIDDSYKLIAIGKATAKELKGYKNVSISDKQNINECIKLAKFIAF
ncbi:uroporphyrinogen-III synthase [Campylobacter sp. FMV-PI01]|uniref:Uroporphyrinogen-III synthase n=1 Tax=Campylobacter portucalensis TaxID=2608384 RepID=A0A6L5WJF9_9BACT|nr:uroporphyrinogen-III synthase [Campylobacter portucalensis]MSN96387.1 uroporphyrinogen-III synthase [Campylobacter portucalensis]